MKTLTRSFVIGTSALALASCGADEIVSPGTGGDIIINPPATPAPTPTPTPTPTGTLVTPASGCPTISNPTQLTDSGTITGPTGTYRVCTMPERFTASSTLPYNQGILYRIDGRVDVGTDGGPAPDASDGASDSNVTLTIEAGAITYASGSSFLVVNRGSDISAVGTATRPIIFTSRDNVQGLNNANSSQQWGGVILAGRAPITDCSAPDAPTGTINCERQVEGAAQPARYGGATANDDSGDLAFVQIRFSGFVLSADNELQALTTGGTGTGTTFNNIMSYNSSDDGVEFFGGFVNMKRLIVVGAEDDSLDVDTGAKTNLQYVIVAQRAGASDAVIESDSSNAFEERLPRQNLQISNATFIANSSVRDQAIRLRGGADLAIVNSVLVDRTGNTPCLRLDGANTLRAADAAQDEAGPPKFNSFVLDCATDFRSGSGGVTAAQVQANFEAGTNNSANFTNTLTMTFVNGANENGVPVFDPTVLSNFFEVPTNIGAVYPGNNTWINGWTCNSATVTFDPNVSDCNSLPVYS